MFKDLKISTGINLLLGLLIVCIIAVSSYALTSAKSSSDNFDDAVMTNNNIDTLNSAILGLTNAMAQVNAGMLATMINQPVNQGDIDNAKKVFAQAEKDMSEFLSTPFKTEKEELIAKDIHKRFESVLEFSLKKINYINNPTSYTNDVVDEAKQRIALKELADEYLTFAEELVTGFGETAQSDAQRMTMFAMVRTAARGRLPMRTL